MKIGLVAAVAQNGVIGLENRLPWYLPEDLKLFRRITLGHAVIMGRKTAESIGRPLPHRRNLVVSSQARIDGFEEVFPSLQSAIQKLDQSIDWLYVIGGAALYDEALRHNWVYAMHISHVLADVEGDTYFPAVDWQKFSLVAEISYPSIDDQTLSFVYKHYLNNFPSIF
jgi:dihydrofolate reductase